MSKYLSFSNNFHAKNIQKYKIMIYETFWKSLTRLSRLLKVSSRPRLSRLANTTQHDMAMDKVKDILAGENSPILAHFDPKLYTTLLTDACKYGLGYSLVQHEHEDHSKAKQFKMITCGSRFLSPAERNYAVCELECLGIQWAVEKCRLYLLGAQFLILTDHKPLLGILNGRDLDSIQNTRLQRITTKLLGYSFKVQWIPGKKQVIADALSRAPVFQPEEEDQADVLIQAVKAL